MDAAEHFTPDPWNARASRRMVASCLSEEGDPSETLDTVVLLTSELVSNAIRHAGTDFTVRLTADARHIRTESTTEPSRSGKTVWAELDF